MVRVVEIKLLLQGLPEIPNPSMAAIDPLPLQLRRVAIENPSLEIQAAESSQSGPVSVPTVAVPDDVELATVQKPTSTKTNSTYKKFEKKYTILLHEKKRINNIHV